MKPIKRQLIGILLLLGIAVIGYAAMSSGAVAYPSAGVEDIGEWGDTTEHHAEIHTAYWVENPYPIDLSTGKALRLNYSLTLNSVTLAEGSRERVDLPRGNTTQTQTTYLRTDRLSAWWVTYLRANETIHANAHGRVRITTPFKNWTYDRLSASHTQFENQEPIRESLSRTAHRTEGTHTRTQQLRFGNFQRTVTVGADVQNANASWGRVDRNQTTVLFHFTIRNPSDTVPLVVEPMGLRFHVDANDVRLFSSESGVLTLESPNNEQLILPGETRDVTISITLDNTKIDDWFTSHIQDGERSQLAVHLQLVVDPLGIDKPVRLPDEDGTTYRCTIQTAILEDNQSAATTCGDRTRRSPPS